MHHLPRQEQAKPSQTCERSSAGPKHGIAAIGIGIIATDAKTIVFRAVDHEHECGEAKSGDPTSVDEHVNEYLEREDALFEVVWGAGKDIC